MVEPIAGLFGAFAVVVRILLNIDNDANLIFTGKYTVLNILLGSA